MFPYLASFKNDEITCKSTIKKIFKSQEFSEFENLNVLPLIYDETKKRCNILVFDFLKARRETVAIVSESKGKGRKHPVFRFYGKGNSYICEVRYGDANANALQRGLWTNTKNALTYFDSPTNGWVKYSRLCPIHC
jgi:hypothetical protein